jgi:hypothetical protein
MPHPHVTVKEDDEDDFITNDLPELQEDDKDEEDKEEEEEYQLEEGDKVYTVNLEHKPEHIRTSRNISQ